MFASQSTVDRSNVASGHEAESLPRSSCEASTAKARCVESLPKRNLEEDVRFCSVRRPSRWLALLLQLLEWPLWWSGRRVTPLGPRNFRGICPWLLFSVDRRCPDKKREGSFVEEKLNEMVIWKAPRGVRNEMEGVVSTGDRRTASFSVD